MEGLGRVCNVIPIAAGKPFRMRSASGVMFVVTGATAQPTLNERSSFGGADTALPVIRDIYWSTATDGTVAWNKLVESTLLPTSIHRPTTALPPPPINVF